MRKFFTRFAANSHGVGTGGGGKDAINDQQGTVGDGGIAAQEKLALSATETQHASATDTGERVRALAARYETLTNSAVRGDSPNRVANESTRNTSPHSNKSWFYPTSQYGKAVQHATADGAQTSSSLKTKGRRERSPLFKFDKPLPPVNVSEPSEKVEHLQDQDSNDEQSNGLRKRSSARHDHLFEAPKLSEHVYVPSLDATEQGTASADLFTSLSLPRQPSSAAILQHEKVSRDASGSSRGSRSTASASAAAPANTLLTHAPTKSVAFAPSPKKPTRPASPDLHSSSSPPISMPTFASDDGMRFNVGASSSSLSNFAKPTLASSARARPSASGSGGGSGSAAAATATAAAAAAAAAPSLTLINTRSSGTERFPSHATHNSLGGGGGGRISSSTSSPLSAGAKMRRTNSAGAKRGSSLGVGTSSLPSTVSGTNAETGVATTTPRSQIHGSGGTASGADPAHVSLRVETSVGHSLPNSIPFVSSSALVALRSASPQSVTTASMGSGPGAGGAPDYFSTSRRTSFQGRFNSGGSGHAAGIKASSSVRSIGAPSWSEMTQDDLVSNLGARERTRQEVLWEIVASEERYVQELEKTKEFFVDALLHPHRFSPPGSPGAVHAATLAALEGRKSGQQQPDRANNGRRIGTSSPSSNATLSPPSDSHAARRGNNHQAELPIAARFMSASSNVGASNAQTYASIDAAALSHAATQQRKNTEGQSPYAVGLGLSSSPLPGGRPQSTGAMAAHAASSLSSPSSTAISTSGASRSHTETTKGKKRWLHRRISDNSTGAASSQVGYDLTSSHGVSLTLPAPLRAVLEAIDNGIYEGHALLSEALRIRYEEQWPLVRSLADVFTRFGYLFKHYTAYVLHLESALDCLEEAALMERAMRGKRLRKDRLSVTVGLGRAVASLEAAAAERGECGLAIFLAMPFQRLLKYPLLFQNLLFHTDASMFEFENTVQMVVDVERIVRSIEDQKTNKEERDKTIDAFARIEGIKDRALLRPKADRILIEERPTYQENPRRAISESNDLKGASRDAAKAAAAATGQDNVANTAMSTPLGVGSGNLRASLRSKRSYRRLSDLLTLGQAAGTGLDTDEGNGNPTTTTYTKAPNMGSKRDIWLVRFSDVELRCQRVGVTALPLVSGTALSPEGAESSKRNDAATDSMMQEEEERMRDEIKRSRESKERLRALRNTTLRSKTRNLYKFLGVSSWKVSRERANFVDVDGIDGLATALEEEEEYLDEDEEEDEDDSRSMGAESNTSQETDGGLLDPEHYIRQSKLSFSYGGLDRVEPKISIAQAPLTTAARSHAHRGYSSGGNSASSSRRGSFVPQQPKRHSMSSASSPPIGSSAGATSAQATPSSGMVTSRSVLVSSKMRADKFGSRLRASEEHPQRQSSMPDVTSGQGEAIFGSVQSRDDAGMHSRPSAVQPSSSTHKHANATSGKAMGVKDDVLQSQSQHVSQADRAMLAPMARPIDPSTQLRPSFVRDQSMDSNLYLMGSLIQQDDKDAQL